ncbi:MAG: sensor histidine kinase [Nocardioidaceae bacterium]
MQLTVVVCAAGPLLRSLRAPQVDSKLRPMRLAAIHGGLASAVVVAVSIIGEQQAIPRLTWLVGGVVSLGIGMLAVGLGWAFLHNARSINRPVSTRIAIVFLGLGIASLIDVFAHAWWPPLKVVSELVAMVAAVLLGVLALSLLRTAIDFNGLRMLSLSLRAVSAEETVRREQERMHELRSTIAGIRSASGALSRYEHELDIARKQTLEQMMGDELARLERLLTSESLFTAPGPVMLDDVIRPLVVRHREQGMTVRWRPTGACALIRADEVAEILNVLLTNAGRHAPESPVEILVEDRRDVIRITVHDEGPGIPAELAERIFERGERSAGSPGQGLGLYIAQRLAANQRGTLALHTPQPGAGAQFALALPAAQVSRQVLPGQRTPSEEA